MKRKHYLYLLMFFLFFFNSSCFKKNDCFQSEMGHKEISSINNIFSERSWFQVTALSFKSDLEKKQLIEYQLKIWDEMFLLTKFYIVVHKSTCKKDYKSKIKKDIVEEYRLRSEFMILLSSFIFMKESYEDIVFDINRFDNMLNNSEILNEKLKRMSNGG